MFLKLSLYPLTGLLMHLCDIPHDRIHEISIPNSLPLVYSYRNKCIQVLDDGLDGSDPLGAYAVYRTRVELSSKKKK